MSARCDNCKRVTESICSHVEGRTLDDIPIYSCVVKYLDDPEDTKFCKLNPEWIKAYGNEKLQLILGERACYLPFCDLCPEMGILGAEYRMNEFHLFRVCVVCKRYFENDPKEAEKLQSFFQTRVSDALKYIMQHVMQCAVAEMSVASDFMQKVAMSKLEL